MTRAFLLATALSLLGGCTERALGLAISGDSFIGPWTFHEYGGTGSCTAPPPVEVSSGLAIAVEIRNEAITFTLSSNSANSCTIYANLLDENDGEVTGGSCTGGFTVQAGGSAGATHDALILDYDADDTAMCTLGVLNVFERN